ncbi:MAG: hypothetical protein LBL41_04135 [Bifidobacteriaceae bacterium]|jgi:hypothetical protein|nr:hypothetical protein [Bifidobacteriaceae bacterium]
MLKHVNISKEIKKNAALVVAMAVALSFVAGSFAYVNAEEILEERAATEVENIISDVSEDAISADDIIEPELVGDELVVETDAVDVSIPLEGDGEICTNVFNISLPNEASDAEAVITNDGTVTYGANDSDETTVAVQTTDEQTRIHTVIPNKDAPNRYTYEISDGIPFLNADGSVDIRKNLPKIDEEGEFVTDENDEFVYELTTVAKFDIPWAKDATGNDIDTHYEIVNNAVVQVIGFDENTQFPVTADPSVLWWATNIALCGVGVATLIWFGPARLASMLANVMKKIAVVRNFVNAHGGVKKMLQYMLAVVKTPLAATRTERLILGQAMGLVIGIFVNTYGLSNCYSLAKEIMK